MLFVYTTIKDKESAQKLSDEVVELKLAARANFWPITSVYFYEGEKRNVEHYMVMFTTHSILAHELESHIVTHHTETVPLFARTEVDLVNNAYQRWVSETLGL